VSLSLGDSCTFRFGNTVDRGRPYTDVELASGDLFVFGGPARFAFHGVPKVDQSSGPADIGLSGERLNITMRVTGLATA
jgi:DNA oxidative demethylase